MRGSRSWEVSSVKCRQRREIPTLGDCSERSVHGAQGKVPVGSDELRDARPLRGCYRSSEMVARREVADKRNFGVRAQAGFQ